MTHFEISTVLYNKDNIYIKGVQVFSSATVLT